MQAPAHSLKFTRSAIKQAFGASVEELFEEFEEVPVASGSIGQVYQAKLSAKGARNTGIDPGSAFYPLRTAFMQYGQVVWQAQAFCSAKAACNIAFIQVVFLTWSMPSALPCGRASSRF